MQQFEFDQMFSMSIISSSTGEKTYQDKTVRRHLKAKGKAKVGLNEQDDEDGEEEEPAMEFSARVLSHTSKEINF